MMDDKDLSRPSPRVRLPFMKSPVVASSDHQDKVVQPDPGLRDKGEDDFVPHMVLGRGFPTYHGDFLGMPIFRKFADASLLELFTDLFFAANYTVFTQTQKVTDTRTLAAYVGYFATLWVTWLLVALYDVRYVTDCVFERATRAVHLGVLVGFAVVAPKFHPHDQDRDTMRTMSIILAISRFTLGIEYSSALWHIRKFKKAHLGLYLQIAFSFVAAFIYLGITFRFQDHNSRVFITWYIVAAFEVTLTIGASGYFDVLSFVQTHLMKRLSLLTVIILGDGIIVLAQDVVVIVQTPNAWNTLTIGLVTAACATIYCVFLVYFDWIRESYLPRWKQLNWVIIHFPFHLALVLFMHGFTQLIMYTKVVDVLQTARLDSKKLEDISWIANATSQEVGMEVAETVGRFFDEYKPTIYALTTVQIAVTNITLMPNSTWRDHPNILDVIAYTGDLSSLGDFTKTDEYKTLETAIIAIFFSMWNSLYDSFGIKITDDIVKQDPNEYDVLSDELQTEVVIAAGERLGLVYTYGYICSGITLILMVVLTAVARKQRWTMWPIVRNSINVALALVMGGMAALFYTDYGFVEFLRSGMIIPTLTLFWFSVLVLTHVGNAGHAIRRRRTDNSSAASSDLSPTRRWRQWRRNGDDRSINDAAVREKTGWSSSGGLRRVDMGSHSSSAETATAARQGSFYGQVGNDGVNYDRGYRRPHQYSSSLDRADPSHSAPPYPNTRYMEETDQPLEVSPIYSENTIEDEQRHKSHMQHPAQTYDYSGTYAGQHTTYDPYVPREHL